MPIPVQELETSAKPLIERIFDVLKSERDKAFNLYELIARVEGMTDDVAALIVMLEMAADSSAKLPTDYRNALAELTKQGRAKQAQVHGTTYYAAKE